MKIKKISEDMARAKLERVIIKEHGKEDLKEVLSMLQVGYTGYSDKVMNAKYQFNKEYYENKADWFPNMKI
jgi:hypothetical protein